MIGLILCAALFVFNATVIRRDAINEGVDPTVAWWSGLLLGVLSVGTTILIWNLIT